MDAINDICDLLRYQVNSLYSAEELVEQAFPAFIEKTNHESVKNALKHHIGLTAGQKQRLLQIAGLLLPEKRNEAKHLLPDASAGKTINKGMTGLLEEVNELLGLELAINIKDAAIIAAVQKIEHYEICSYGTAVAFARQLHLHKVAQLLDETLREEYDADDLLTALATAAINKEGMPEETVTGSPSPDTVTGGEQESDTYIEHTEVEESERNIHSPGGRAGTSHRGYGTGESRGH